MDLPFITVPPSGGDDTAAIIAALASFGAGGGGTLQLLRGRYVVTRTITVSQGRIRVIGAGEWATVIVFQPTAHDQAVFEFSSGANVIFQCTIADLTLTSSDTAFRKVGIRLTDSSDTLVERIAIGPLGNWTDASGNSIGFQTRGREMLRARDLNIAADLPISIEKNPNSTLSTDHFHFSDLILGVTNSDIAQPNIKIADGVMLSDLLIDGTNTLNNGRHGIYWDSPSATLTSDKITLRNIRYESGRDGYTVYLADRGSTRHVLLEQVSGGGPINGFYLRGTSHVTLLNCQAIGLPGTVGLDADATVHELQLINCFFLSGTTISTPGLQRLVAVGTPFDGGEPVWNFELWQSTANTNFTVGGLAASFLGVLQWATTGTLAAGQTLELPFGGGSGKTAIVQVQALSASGTKQAGIIALVTPGKAYAMAAAALGEATYAPFHSPPGRVTLYCPGGTQIQLINGLDEAIDYAISMQWR